MGVLRKFVRRLQELSRDQSIVACGGQVESAIRFVKDSCHKLKSALAEIQDAISALQQTASWDDFDIVVTTLESSSTAVEGISQAILQVYDRVTSTAPPVLTQGAYYHVRGTCRT